MQKELLLHVQGCEGLCCHSLTATQLERKNLTDTTAARRSTKNLASSFSAMIMLSKQCSSPGAAGAAEDFPLPLPSLHWKWYKDNACQGDTTSSNVDQQTKLPLVWRIYGLA
eukprot:jgi/Botrbrau1/14513/Bobra.0223s0003.1